MRTEKVGQEIRDRWKLLFQFGDIQAIHEESGLSRTTISNALKHGEMTRETFEAIDLFYVKKESQKLTKV
jgi:hypothetical protein